MRTTYRNTDLDLVSSTSLQQLARYLESAGLVLLGHHQDGQGDWHAILEIIGEEDDRFHENAEATIVAMLGILEALPDQERLLFERCKLREFNTAYDCGEGPVGFNEALSEGTISRMSALTTGLRMTLYPGKE